MADGDSVSWPYGRLARCSVLRNMASITVPGRLERVKGIEPSYAAWEAAVLPLNYTRVEGNSKA